MVWYLVLKKMQNFRWNAVRPTRFIVIKRWYYFINFFCIYRSYYERISDFWWQKLLEWFMWKFDFWVNNFSNRGKKVIKSISNWDWIINVFLSLVINEGVSLFFCFIDTKFYIPFQYMFRKKLCHCEHCKNSKIRFLLIP